MDYFLITLSAVCVAAQFTFNKLYQKNIVKSTGELLLFPLITGVIATLLFLCLNVFSVAYSSCFLVYLLFFRKKNAAEANAEGESAAGFTLSKRILLLALGIGAGYALVSGAGYLLQLNAAKTLPATMLYPFITGGSILFSTFAARIFFKEKINLYTWISLALMLCGTILFIF